MTIESRKLGMLLYAGLAALVMVLYQETITPIQALGAIAPIGVYAFADQIKHRNLSSKPQ